MKLKIYILILILCLIGSYLIWSSKKEKIEEEYEEQIPILDLDKEDLKRLIYKTERQEVRIVPQKEGKSLYFWVYLKTKKFIPPQQKTEKTKKHPPKWEKESFRGNEFLTEFIEGFTPFYGTRSLGRLSKSKLKEFEIEGSKKRLILVTKKKSRYFIIGRTTYGGNDYYLQDKETKNVYIVARRVLQPLEFPKARLMERELHRFKQEEIEAIIIAKGETKKEILHKRRHNLKESYWVAKGSKKKDEFYKNWMDKVFRLRALEYIENPKDILYKQNRSLELVPLFKLSYLKKGKEFGFLEMSKVQVDENEVEYYARTENTKKLVKLASFLAEEVAKDAEKVIEK